ncbi:MAG: HAD-IG family 5'-nucleotidase [Candidatus Krumholzibacteriia bacterium]|nr:HAD-IG family 5'-nucleotidase [Candidatus Latescibacterota bacterium]
MIFPTSLRGLPSEFVMHSAPDLPFRLPPVASHRFEQFIEKRHRIFVNRNLRMSSVRWVGFDMDHTLALYNRNFIEALVFDMAKEVLVAEGGYTSALRSVRYDPDFGIRGLVVDKERGNILKVDKFHYVAEAFHGRERVDKETRKALYTGGSLRLSGERFWSNDTLFGLPEISLYAGVVEALEATGQGEPDYRRLFDDIRNSVDQVHRDGSLKAVVLERLGECFLRDPRLPAALEKLRREGKKLFLLTNSDFAYTDAVLRYVLADGILDRPWWSYFDLLVTDSQKPGFFAGDAPWADGRGDCHGTPCFAGGNVALLEQQLGAAGDEILYVGDHIYGDILRSKKSVGWRTLMVVEELEHEIRATEESSADNARIDGLQVENEGILTRLLEVREALEAGRDTKLTRYRSLPPEDLKALDDRLAALTGEEHNLDRQLTANLLAIRAIELEIRQRFNPFWGPLCKVDSELSRFGDQMGDFACVYTARVSNLLFYPPDKYFLSPEEFLPHEL